MKTLMEPGKPASENPVTLRASLRIDGVSENDARKAYRIWGRACKAMTEALRPDYGDAVNVVISPELGL